MANFIGKALQSMYLKLFGGASTKRSKREMARYFSDREGVLRFETLTIQHSTPKNEDINEKDFVQVIYKGKPMWALFRCPCGCHTVISLSLQDVHHPHWWLSTSHNDRPSLYPSVWQRVGCRSHFWIYEGRVYWV